MKKRIYSIIAILVFHLPQYGNATHLLGQYFTYSMVKVNGTTSAEYHLKIEVYRDCIHDVDPNVIVPFDNALLLCVYSQNGGLLTTVTLAKTSGTYANIENPDNCNSAAFACVAKAVYDSTVTLPFSGDGYIIQWVRCCRGHDKNLQKDNTDTPLEGMTVLAKIPAPSIQNSSPAISNDPIARICFADTANWLNQFSDPDGDSLSYEIVTPSGGGSIMTPLADNCAAIFTNPPNVKYAVGYSLMNLFGSNGLYKVDSSNGKLMLFSAEVGYFSGSMDITEWRNQKVLSKNRLDFTVMVDFALSTKSNERISLQTYPNPAQSEINVIGLKDNCFFAIYDGQSREVLSGTIEDHRPINVNELASGVYWLRILDKHQVIFVQKIILQK